MSHSLLFHMEWFRHEIHPHVRDDGEDYVRFLMDVLEQRIRHSLHAASPPPTSVPVVEATTPRKRKQGATVLTPGVHRIVDGEFVQDATPTSCRPQPPPPVQHVWSLPEPLSWSSKKRPRVARQRR